MSRGIKTDFLLRFPCFLLQSAPFFTDEKGALLPDGRGGFPVIRTEEGVALLAFTERDSAIEFIVDHCWVGSVLIVSIHNPIELAALAAAVTVAQRGLVGVIFDRSKSFRGFELTHEEVVRGGTDEPQGDKDT